MNRTQFLAALAKTPRDWRLTGNKIRLTQPVATASFAGDCPLAVVTLLSLPTGIVHKALPDLGIESLLRRRIAATADGIDFSSYYSSELRAQLLGACGLAEDNSS